jgi:uncharacterized paraquat-inducible protein A
MATKLGGAGEPYCSDLCYDDAGKLGFEKLQQGIHQRCAFCRTMVTKSLDVNRSDMAFHFVRKRRFAFLSPKVWVVCQSCLDKAKTQFAQAKECTYCGKPLSERI